MAVAPRVQQSGHAIMPLCVYNACYLTLLAPEDYMQHLHPISADEMVAVFLKTELASSRFSQTILSLLNRDGQTRQIVEQPDLTNLADTVYRRQLLGEWRGYQRNADVFTGFPSAVRWYRALATRDDLAAIRYLNDDYWTVLSGGSRRVVDAVERIRQGIEAFQVRNDGFWFMADALCAGAVFPELILVGTDEQAPLVVLEGHVRLTAYVLRLECTPVTVPVLVGYAPDMEK